MLTLQHFRLGARAIAPFLRTQDTENYKRGISNSARLQIVLVNGEVLCPS